MITALSQEVAEIEEAITQLKFPKKPNNLYDPLVYFLSLGGKRIRSALLLKTIKLLNISTPGAFQSVLAIELFHNFTLIHDDIMDKSPLRRGKPTIHQKWDENIAILSGDALMIEAYKQLSFLSSETLPVIFKRFNTIALQVCDGQQLDMDFETQMEVRSEDYLEMIRLKTAVLLGFSLECAGLLAGDKILANQLYQIGESIGMAFQINDDILDTFPKGNVFGKQIGGDILAGKKTLLYTLAIEHANEEEKQQLKKIFSAKERGVNEIEVVTSMFQKKKVDKLANQEAEKYTKKAHELIKELNDASVQSMLLQAATFLLNRVS